MTHAGPFAIDRRPPRGSLGLLCLLFLCLAPTEAHAQRQLHWDRLEVSAFLKADGTLSVTEMQSMVFTGDWNGGEREFNIRPRQGLTVITVYREVDGNWRELRYDPSLDDVDEYAMSGEHTLRWRSRRPEDPPFSSTLIRYRIHYELSGILLKEGDRYRLDHDFAFPERDGSIAQFELALSLDDTWQPESPLELVYSAGPLAPGRSFVLDIPLRFTGVDSPNARDLTRSSELVMSVSTLLGATALAIVALFARESRYGRFAPLKTDVDEGWVRDHILRHPAEVVAAIWDENIGSAEVVALLARMEAEGKIETWVTKGKSGSPNMMMRLKVDRASLKGYELALINKLFFGSRFETSTEGVHTHYKSKGFSPVDAITAELEKTVDALVPPDEKRRRFSPISITMFVLGLLLIGYRWTQGHPGGFPLISVMLVVTLVGWVTGSQFRSYVEWGWRAAFFCLLPALIVAIGTAAYLWFYAGAGEIEFAPVTSYGIVLVMLACVLSCINAMKSRRSAAAIEFRKRLAAGRAYFARQLESATPALRDEWYPWLLGLELSKQVDAWSTRASGTTRSDSRATASRTSSPSSSSSPSFGGFSGGRSGGGGASASWHAAASGIAANLAAPSSSGSGGSSSRSSGGGGGGRSGGGGGGGW